MADVTFEFLNSLVQLSSFPKEEWVGKTVYHPMGGQCGNDPYWRFNETPESWKEIEREFETPEHPIEPFKLIYDVGVVHRVEVGPWGPDYEEDVYFGEDGPDGFCLVYTPCNLWTEK